MTVKELKAELSKYPDDLCVLIGDNAIQDVKVNECSTAVIINTKEKSYDKRGIYQGLEY